MIIIPKQPGWDTRLGAVVRSAAARKFEPGTHDCALYADECFEAQTGTSFAAELRGQYSTLEDGLKLLQSLGYLDHVAFVAAKLPEIPVAFAQIGDIAAVQYASTASALAVVGGHRLSGPMPGMRGTLPLTSAFRAFAVGREPEF